MMMFHTMYICQEINAVKSSLGILILQGLLNYTFKGLSYEIDFENVDAN
jgi:hypothetical protein